ncbi:MAG: DUF255 domain-containing protein [Verrucomicrobiota bacterium]
MKSRSRLGWPSAAILLGGLVLGAGACRKPASVSNEKIGTSAVLAPDLAGNTLSKYPGAVYHSQVGSAIHWQPWTRSTLDNAKAAQRLLFVVIALPQQPGFQSVLSLLNEDPALVSAINDRYVPVLVDGDAAREIGLLTSDLCNEIRRPLQLPLFVWMTPDGNPMAWIPVSPVPAETVAELFYQSDSMVSRTWDEDPSYVLKNSGMDAANRKERISRRVNSKAMSEQPGEDALKAVSRLNSLYDPLSRSFDEAGGLFPSGAIDLLATTAIQPGVPEEARKRSMQTTRELLKDLLPSAMFDPLDGGVFTARRGSAWALPAFSRDCVSQARVAVALLNAYRATGDSEILERALALISFAEKSFQTREGLFAVGMPGDTATDAWLWSIEDIEEALPPEDAAWWIKMTSMQGLGNLPSEVDTRREYFRSNSLGIAQSPAAMAADLGISPEAFAPRFEGARKILLKARDARLGPTTRDDSSSAGATFRMVSAYAAAYAATGEGKFRDSAVALLGKARTAFAEGPALRVFSREAPASLGAGRAFIYGLALQAALDVSAITLDEQWLVWSEDLATTAAEKFTGDGFLRECPQDAQVLDLPVTDLVMLFDDSTAGLISFAECRLAERRRPLVDSFSELATPLPTVSVERPILHTDLLQATLAREFPLTVIYGTVLTDDLRAAVERLPLRMVQRRAAKSEDEIPAGAVKVDLPGSPSRLVSTAAELRDLLASGNP